MYLNTTVKIPEMKGKIISKKKAGTTYILYQYGSEYNPDKKYAVPLRTIVRKVSPSNATLMFPKNNNNMVLSKDCVLHRVWIISLRSVVLKEFMLLSIAL